MRRRQTRILRNFCLVYIIVLVMITGCAVKEGIGSFNEGETVLQNEQPVTTEIAAIPADRSQSIDDDKSEPIKESEYKEGNTESVFEKVEQTVENFENTAVQVETEIDKSARQESEDDKGKPVLNGISVKTQELRSAGTNIPVADEVKQAPVNTPTPVKSSEQGNGNIPEVSVKRSNPNVTIPVNPTKHTPVKKDFVIQRRAAEIYDIKLKYEGITVNYDLPVYVVNSRYYLPMEETIRAIGGSIHCKELMWYLSVRDISVSICQKDNNYSLNGKSIKLYKKIDMINGTAYISLYDFVKIFNLKTRWDTANGTISTFHSRENPEVCPPREGRPAVIRFEDVVAGEDANYNSEELEKVRIITDYLYTRGIPVHIAWIPRYINPILNIDNDISKDISMYNMHFVFTLDYIINRNGLIGLHGYTHHSGNEASGAGWEFGRNTFISDELTHEKFQKAIEAAVQLDFSISFFEFPHYAASDSQIQIAEQYFDCIYQPKPRVKHIDVLNCNVDNRLVRYIPTPLDHMTSRYDVENILKRIQAIQPDTLASLFYHPPIDYGYIKLLEGEDGYPSYTYDIDSPLHRVINALEDRGYKFVTIDDL